MKNNTTSILENRKYKIEPTTTTRNISELNDPTDNIYETVCIIARRANQIALEIKEELTAKIEEFAAPSDNLEEVFENREQIELAKHYENLPKPTLIATNEFLHNQVFSRNPHKEHKDKELL
jgi:DNA-directed RNA polymerase subunit K/omega